MEKNLQHFIHHDCHHQLLVPNNRSNNNEIMMAGDLD